MNSINKKHGVNNNKLQQQTKPLPQTKETSLGERLTVIHIDHGPRVPF
jgi:hypothetical protein